MKTKIIKALMVILITSGISFADGPEVGKLKLKNENSGSKKWSSLFLEAEYSYTRHLGEYEKVWGSSQTGAISFGKKFEEHYMLYFKTGYSKTSEWKNEREGNSMIPLLIGGKYYFDLGNFMPYFAFTNGFNVISQKYDNFGGETDDMLVKYAWQLGTGAYYVFGKSFALNGTVSYNSSFYYIEAQMTGFVYSGGMTFFFR